MSRRKSFAGEGDSPIFPAGKLGQSPMKKRERYRIAVTGMVNAIQVFGEV